MLQFAFINCCDIFILRKFKENLDKNKPKNEPTEGTTLIFLDNPTSCYSLDKKKMLSRDYKATK